MNEAVNCESVAQAIGTYSLAVRAGALVFVSAQAGQDPATGRLVSPDVSAQVAQALVNIEHILIESGKRLKDVARVGVYLSNMADLAAVNAIYGQYSPLRCPHGQQSASAAFH
ncbi:MAG: Rid family hydrolase [Streptosporangiaceae bacterium]